MNTIALPVCHCCRCGHGWIGRKAELPLTCPSCRSAYWRTDRLEASDRARPYLSRCPYCSWVASFRREERAAEVTLAHVRKKHGEEAVAEIVNASGVNNLDSPEPTESAGEDIPKIKTKAEIAPRAS